MMKKSKRPPLELDEEQHKHIDNIANSRTLPKREVERAQMILLYYKGYGIQDIATKLGTTRPTVYKCVDKALAMGYEAGLKDLPHSPKQPEITLEAKAWVTHLACTKPKDLGLAAEVWSRQSLANYVKKYAIANGHPSLSKACKSTVHCILKENKLQPHKIKYYLERRDPEFENKMREVLLVYQDVHLENKKDKKDRNIPIPNDYAG